MFGNKEFWGYVTIYGLCLLGLVIFVGGWALIIAELSTITPEGIGETAGRIVQGYQDAVEK